MLIPLLWLMACATTSSPAGPSSPDDTATAGLELGLTTGTLLPVTTDTAHPTTSLPTHDECLPPGERMSDETCLAVIEHDGRLPGQSFDKSGVEVVGDDPRVGSDDLLWLTAEIERCTCSCCPQSSLGGPGAYVWDLDYDGVWLDSASRWSLQVLAGIHDSENQVLPTDDLPRVQQIVLDEIARRDAAD